MLLLLVFSHGFMITVSFRHILVFLNYFVFALWVRQLDSEKYQGQNVLCHQCFSYQRKKEFFNLLIHPIILYSFLLKDDSKLFVYVLKTDFRLLAFFDVLIQSIDFRMHFWKKDGELNYFFVELNYFFVIKDVFLDVVFKVCRWETGKYLWSTSTYMHEVVTSFVTENTCFFPKKLL